MLHIFEQQRPDQTRGVAAMVSALKEMRITKQFRDVTLQNAVVNATYAASIESDLPSDIQVQWPEDREDGPTAFVLPGRGRPTGQKPGRGTKRDPSDS